MLVKSSIFLILSCAAIFFGNNLLIFAENSEPSTLANVGRIIEVRNAKRLPSSGTNFKTYSRFLSTIGRTHVHSRLKVTILDSYKNLEKTAPHITWVFAETGWKNGGNFWPHRTHRNGLSIDFIVPVVDKKNNATTMYLWPFNGYGYNIRFNSQGIYGGYKIDFPSIIKHVHALKASCSQHGLIIKRIILDPPLLKLLKDEPTYELITDIPFMGEHAWFPHDSHYHIDFAIKD